MSPKSHGVHWRGGKGASYEISGGSVLTLPTGDG